MGYIPVAVHTPPVLPPSALVNALIPAPARNTILVLKNYEGTNLGEFRRNLATYGAVKVRYDGETKGGVETLEVAVNAENYKSILELFKEALIENAMGYDAKDDRLSGNPNQMNIQSMYSDIDLDAVNALIPAPGHPPMGAGLQGFRLRVSPRMPGSWQSPPFH